jgi:hypothetical protein
MQRILLAALILASSLTLAGCGGGGGGGGGPVAGTDDDFTISSAIIRGSTLAPATVTSDLAADNNASPTFFEFDLGSELALPTEIEITAQDLSSGQQTAIAISVDLS